LHLKSRPAPHHWQEKKLLTVPIGAIDGPAGKERVEIKKFVAETFVYLPGDNRKNGFKPERKEL
jgi:hypothetical protein